MPDTNDWPALLDFKVSAIKPLPSRQFLKRIQLEAKVTAAAKIKAEQDISEKSGSREGLEKAIEKIVDNFALTARNYVTFLIESVLGHVQLTSTIVRGLGSFDSRVVFSLPTSLSYKLFSTLFSCFSSRGWVKEYDSQLCLDQYISLIEELRSKHESLIETPDVIVDIVGFFATLDLLRNRPLLHYVFSLSCLCLTETSQTFPVVKFSTIDTSKPTCGLLDVIFPVQSYVSNVPDAGEVCSRGLALDQFLEKGSTYGRLCLSDVYDAWSSVDYCGRQGIFDHFLTTYRQVMKSRDKKGSSSKGSTSSAVSVSKSLAVPKKVGHVNYGSISSKEVDKTVSHLAASSSKR